MIVDFKRRALRDEARSGRHRSHQIVPVSECRIAHPLVTAAGVTGRRWPGAQAVDVDVTPKPGGRSSGPKMTKATDLTRHPGTNR